MKRRSTTNWIGLVAGLALACASPGGSGDADTADGAGEAGEEPTPGATEEAAGAAGKAHNTLTEAERAAGWRLLFDGETLAGWRAYASEMPPEGWRAEDGALHRFASGGDIMTVDQFDGFELSLEWKVPEGGNSGIFYHGRTGYDYIHDVAPEMQVLDDEGHADGGDPLTSAGAVYGLYPAPRGVVRPAGEWNRARIIVRGDHVEHWLNGKRIVEYELGSEDWNERVADSKFAGTDYGRFRSGHIGLQDHGDPVWYRNIKLLPIAEGASEADPVGDGS